MAIDHGIELNASDRQRGNEKARLVEAHTGQQSFDSYVKEHREDILRSLDAAATTGAWQDLHAL